MEKSKGGGHACAICSHPDHEAINAQLAALVPLRKLSKRYGISISSLSRHHSRHMSKTEFASIKRARAGLSKASPKSVRERIEEGLVVLEALMARSAKNKEHAQWLSAYRERLRTLEIIGKATGEFSDAPNIVVNLHQSQEWQRLRVVIFEVLKDYPQIRARLAAKLLELEGATNGKDAN